MGRAAILKDAGDGTAASTRPRMTGRVDSGSAAQVLAEAYDDLAATYDRLVEGDLWMRRVLRHRFMALFAAGDLVLDVACGTGLETLCLVRRGVRVTGIDISPRSIDRLRDKAAAEGLSSLVETRVHDVSASLPWGPESFDGIVSVFAGLNTVGALGDFSAEAGRVLKPGGRLLVHMVAPSGIWDRLPLIVRLRWGEARALKLRRERTKRISGHLIRHQVFPAAEAYRRFFGSCFHLRRAYGLGFLWPQRLGHRLPVPLAYRFGRIEACLGRLNVFTDCGRFYVLEMEKKKPVQTRARC